MRDPFSFDGFVTLSCLAIVVDAIYAYTNVIVALLANHKIICMVCFCSAYIRNTAPSVGLFCGVQAYDMENNVQSPLLLNPFEWTCFWVLCEIHVTAGFFCSIPCIVFWFLSFDRAAPTRSQKLLTVFGVMLTITFKDRSKQTCKILQCWLCNVDLAT